MQQKPKPKKTIDSLIQEIESSVNSLSNEMSKDIEAAEKVQKALLPKKFPTVSGIQVTHKYLSGLKSGGDYFDFFEFSDKQHIGILMSDCTGYGLSSAFMSMILSLTVKFSKENNKSPSETISLICNELKISMKATESLSIFYGILDRKTFEMKFVSFGNVHCYRQSASGSFETLNPTTEPLRKEEEFSVHEGESLLEPGDRLILVSDGVRDVYRSEKTFCEKLKSFSKKNAQQILNEFTYEIKKHFSEDDDMPEQDASALILDFSEKILRLTK